MRTMLWRCYMHFSSREADCGDQHKRQWGSFPRCDLWHRDRAPVKRDPRGRLVDGQPEDAGWTVYHPIGRMKRLVILLREQCLSVGILYRRFCLLLQLAIT